MRFLLFLSLLLASCATTPYSSYLPPSRFDYPHPNPIITYLPIEDVDLACRGKYKNLKALPNTERIIGCAVYRGNPCRMIIPSLGPKVSKARQEAIIRHERAHCNGWLPTHPR